MGLASLIFKDRSLFYKLTILSVIPVICVTIIIIFKLMGSVEQTLIKEASNRADSLINYTRLSMSHSFVIYNKELLDNMINGLAGFKNVRYAFVVDSADNRILTHNDHNFDGRLFHEIEKETKGENPLNAGQIYEVFFYSKITPIIIDDTQYASLYTGFSFDDVQQKMALFKQNVLLFTLLALIIGTAFSLYVAKKISAPINNLARQAELAGKGNFVQPLVYESRDAIGKLADAFNRMLEEIHNKHKQLIAINSIADIVYSSLEIETVAQNAVTAMMNYSRSPGVAIFRLNEELRQLEMIFSKGFDPETLKQSAVLPLDGSLTGSTVNQKQILSSVNISSDARLAPNVKQSLIAGGSQSILSIPLLARERVLGAMNLINKEPYKPSGFEKETLISIGKTIGLAMANALQVNTIQREIEERREVEQALRQSEIKFRNLVELANDGIVIIQDGLIRYANPRAIALSGQEAIDFIDQPFVSYLHPDQKAAIENKYYDRMEGEAIAGIYETLFIRKDGKQIPAEVNAARITYLDRPADLVFIRDITERKRAQEALKIAYEGLEKKVEERTAELAIAKERAEESDRLKSAFLASMSHELRTPLNSIIGFTGIMVQKLVGPLNDEQLKQLLMVQNSANHLLSLINDVLDLSKIEAGQLDVASEEFSLADLINKAVSTVSPMALQKGIGISVEISPDIGIIRSDRRRVEQVLLNLLNNAIKFTQEGDVSIHCEKDGQWIITSVRDTGIGIAKKDINKLFQAFQQIETGLTRRFEGTGLGLSICKKLLSLLGGEISAHSEGENMGAVFVFKLPAGE